jgi:hypothetical protein
MAGQDFQILEEIVQPDSRGRLSIGAVTKGNPLAIRLRVLASRGSDCLPDEFAKLANFAKSIDHPDW